MTPPRFRAVLARRLHPWLRVWWLVAAAITLVQLPLAAAMVGDGWRDALRPAVLRPVLTGTSVGTAWMVQVVAAVLLGAALSRSGPRRAAVAAAPAALFLAASALTGHAAMQEGLVGRAHQANDVTHLLAAGFWAGALVPVACTLRALDDDALHGEAVQALMRFSFVGHLAVAVTIATGVANMVLVLGHWPVAWTSPYQMLLAIKIGLVVVMVTLALANRYILVPRLRLHAASARLALRAATLAELLIGCGVIALVAVFGQLDPS